MSFLCCFSGGKDKEKDRERSGGVAAPQRAPRAPEKLMPAPPQTPRSKEEEVSRSSEAVGHLQPDTPPKPPGAGAYKGSSDSRVKPSTDSGADHAPKEFAAPKTFAGTGLPSSAGQTQSTFRLFGEAQEGETAEYRESASAPTLSTGSEFPKPGNDTLLKMSRTDVHQGSSDSSAKLSENSGSGTAPKDSPPRKAPVGANLPSPSAKQIQPIHQPAERSQEAKDDENTNRTPAVSLSTGLGFSNPGKDTPPKLSHTEAEQVPSNLYTKQPRKSDVDVASKGLSDQTTRAGTDLPSSTRQTQSTVRSSEETQDKGADEHPHGALAHTSSKDVKSPNPDKYMPSKTSSTEAYQDPSNSHPKPSQNSIASTAPKDPPVQKTRTGTDQSPSGSQIQSTLQTSEITLEGKSDKHTDGASAPTSSTGLMPPKSDKDTPSKPPPSRTKPSSNSGVGPVPKKPPVPKTRATTNQPPLTRQTQLTPPPFNRAKGGKADENTNRAPPLAPSNDARPPKPDKVPPPRMSYAAALQASANSRAKPSQNSSAVVAPNKPPAQNTLAGAGQTPSRSQTQSTLRPSERSQWEKGDEHRNDTSTSSSSLTGGSNSTKITEYNGSLPTKFDEGPSVSSPTDSKSPKTFERAGTTTNNGRKTLVPNHIENGQPTVRGPSNNGNHPPHSSDQKIFGATPPKSLESNRPTGPSQLSSSQPYTLSSSMNANNSRDLSTTNAALDTKASTGSPSHLGEFGSSLEALMRKRLPVNLTGQVKDLDYRNPAHGGLSSVYQGHYGNQPVAVKILKASKRQSSQLDWDAMERRFQREIMVWAALDHPNILVLLGIAEGFGDFPAMISIWCERGTIWEYISDEGDALTIKTRLRLTKDVAKGLKYLHQLGVIHGDLKPNNILISNDGTAQLCDFGLVRLADWQGPSGMTTTSPYTRTERYKAPELFVTSANRYPVSTFEGDIYSLGLVMLEIVEAIVPFKRFRLSVDLQNAIQDGEAPAFRSEANHALLGMTDSFWDMLEACWDEASKRPTVDMIVDALEQFSRTWHS